MCDILPPNNCHVKGEISSLRRRKNLVKSLSHLHRRYLSTKQRKMRQNTINCTHYFSTLQIFLTFLMWRIDTCDNHVMWKNFSTSCGTCHIISTHTSRATGDKYDVCIGGSISQEAGFRGAFNSAQFTPLPSI